MNDTRRKQIAVLVGKIEELAANAQEIRQELETLQSDEQDGFDNMPEGLQGSERGEKMQAAIDALSEAAASIEQIEDATSEALASLETAAE